MTEECLQLVRETDLGAADWRGLTTAWCTLPMGPQMLDAVTSDLCKALEEAGCPLAPSVQDRLRFETLLAELSATFANLPPGQVDSRIESSLQRLVGFLGVDRGGLAELLVD